MKLLRSAGLILLGLLMSLAVLPVYPSIQGVTNGNIARIVVEFDDGSTQVFLPSGGGLPTPPVQPTPSATASATERPPLVIPTVTPEPTPTPETGCWITATGNVNVRGGPGTSYAVIAVAPLGSITRALARSADGGWYKVWWFPKNAYGWTSAAYWTPEGVCTGLPTESIGVWIGTGAYLQEILSLGETLKATGIQPVATVYGYDEMMTWLVDKGWTVVARPWIGDCPYFNTGPERNAEEWVDKAVAALAGRKYTWLSLSNECLFPDAEYAATWIRAAIREAERLGVPRLVPVVWSTGHPELSDVPTLAAAYQDATIPVCWGINVYSAIEGLPLSLLDDYTAWTTFRYRLYRADLHGVPLCVTEFAAGRGSTPPDFEDMRRWVQMTRGEFLFATAWYDSLPYAQWAQANLRGQLAQLALALIDPPM